MDKAVAALVVVTLLTKPVMLVDFVPGLQPMVLVTVVAFMAWVLLSGRVRKRPLPPIFPLAFAITVLGSFSLLYAMNPLLGFRQFASTFPLRPLFFLCMLLWIDSINKSRHVMKTIFVCGVIFAAHGVLQAFSSVTGLIPGAGDFGVLGRVNATSVNIIPVINSDDMALGFVFPRVQSFFSEPAFYMGFLNVCLFLGLSLGLAANKRTDKYLYLGGSLLIVVVAPLTMSTAGVFSMIVGLVLYAGLAHAVLGLRKGVRYGALVAIILAGLGTTAALRTPVGQMVYEYTIFERFSGESGSVSDRARGFGLAREIIRTNPLGGVGYGNELEAAVPIIGHASSQYSSHLISFIQMGILGFLLHLAVTAVVLIAFLESFRHLRSLRNPQRESYYLLLIGPFVGFVTLSGHGLLIPNSWWYIQWYVYVLAYSLQNNIRAQLTRQHLLSTV